MIAPLAFLGDFGEAVKLIFQPRESVSGGIMIGGLHEFGSLALKHMEVSLAALAIACLISIPLGLYLGHIGKAQIIAINTSNVGRAVPALVLLAFFVAYLGLGFQNVCAVLTLLAIPPILTNTYVGVRQVERETVDASRGMGLTGRQIARLVEFPLALPTIAGGIRTSAVAVVATATISPLANWDSLGTPIVEPQTYGFPGQLAAAIVVALITLLTDAGLGLAQRALTPKGLRVQAPAGRRRMRLPLSQPRSTQAS